MPAPGANSSAAYANLVTVDKSAGVLNSYGRVVQDVFHAQPYQHPFDQVIQFNQYPFPAVIDDNDDTFDTRIGFKSHNQNNNDNCSQNPEGAQRSINQWVQRKSNDKIKQLLPPGSVTADTKVVLANVLHFRSRWQRAFDQTDKGPSIIDVTLM